MPSADDANSCPDHSLRPLRLDDAPAVLGAYESAVDMDRQGAVATLEQARAQVSWLLAEDRQASAIVDRADTLIGLVAISIDRENLLGWFFYWLHAAHRGQGLAGRAAAAVADRALAPSADGGWGLERLELGHRVDNPSSGAVARAAGFVHEGTQRQKFLISGKRVDVLTYGRLRSDPCPTVPGLAWFEPSGAGG